MKKFLMAGVALAMTGAAAYALDDDHVRQTRIHVTSDSQATFVGGDGQIVEIRGADGDRTIHIDRDGEESIIEIDGQRIEIANGAVRVDGQLVDVANDGVVVIDGMDIRVIEGNHARMGREIQLHMAERAEHLAEMENHVARMVIDMNVEGIEEGVMQSLELALSGLDENRIVHSDDWDDLTPEEQEEVRAELREAREEIREAMSETRRELRDAHVEMEGARRMARIEIERATRDMARAERDMARARVEILRAGEDARHVDVDRMRHILRDSDTGSIRIEEDDGRRRVWIDGEEQTGDDLVDWLNRLETDRLEGRHDGRHEGRRAEREMRVERLHHGEGRRIIELDGGERVVIVEIDEDDDER
ncbi:hypothetical protein [Maricaulis maris]|uniref:hypothetical protein n=1 Tax=Maricaulis maris TaxID=74318 RepID=UPI003B8D29B6